MNDCFAILIDGGFARRALRKREPATAAGFQALVDSICGHAALRDLRLHRVYYYDAAVARGVTFQSAL
jgi:hypothetical protein